MEVAMPISGAAIDCYEDMFKEITRKLYGEDGLPELGIGDRINANVPERNQLTDYEVDNPLLKPDDHLTAFGLAALMQNGFSTSGILTTPFHKSEDYWTANEDVLPWTQSKIATYNPSQKTFRCAECDCAGMLARIAEHWLGTHSNIRAFRCPHCPYESAWARCVRMHLSRQHSIETDESSPAEAFLKNNPVLQEINKYLQRLKTKLDGPCVKTNTQEDFSSPAIRTSGPEISSTSGKRYNCTYCPYATDRRDLFTRHENIHREEKPFQCYVCQKQFNRADHVKKHFLRMHREHPYDLNRIRRHPPKNASGMSYYQKYNSNTHTLPDSNNSLSIPSGFQGLKAPIVGASRIDIKPNKNGMPSKPTNKKRGEKRFTCCYCSWSGVDNWCLKRHMNTHLKPFICVLCDYKAARSERLATHVLKVHNKRACGKCNFLADEAAQLISHQQEHHPLEQRNRNNSTNNSSLRSTSFSGNITTPNSCSQGSSKSLIPGKSWRANSAKQHGAARLFNYLEASDGSEPETESRNVDDLNRLNLTHRIQSDFREAGDVGERVDEDHTGETELPLFICPTCGCEFEDDASLDTHQYTHRYATSPAKIDCSKENVDPSNAYQCRLCSELFNNQSGIINHMATHLTLTAFITSKKSESRMHKRKQTKPQRLVIPHWDFSEVEVIRHLNGKLRKWRNGNSLLNVKLADKYMAQLVTRHGLRCFLCPANMVSRFHTNVSLSFHRWWRHRTRKFKCEHCDSTFQHRYQVVLHGGRVHVKSSQTVLAPPNPLPTHHHISTAPLHPPNIPDISGVAKFSEIGMAFLDHSFIQSTANSINHIPIIIPTFPPN